MGMKGKVESKPLSEERAVEMGSEIIGEAFLYSVAAAYIVFEYWRSTRKDKRHEEVQNREISDLHSQTQRLEGQVAQLQLTMESLKPSYGHTWRVAIMIGAALVTNSLISPALGGHGDRD